MQSQPIIRKTDHVQRTLALLLILALFPLGAREAQGVYTATAGRLDLSRHDFALHPVVDLRGEWLLIPEKIVAPEDIDRAMEAGEAYPVKVPGGWQNQDFGGVEVGIFGAGTCVLDVILPTNAEPLVYYKELIYCSNVTYLNGKPFGGPLILEEAGEDAVRPNGPEYYPVPRGSDQLRIVVHASNQWDAYGIGIQVTPVLGNAQYITERRFKSIGYEAVLMGLLAMTALYHLMLFLIQRKDKAILYFSLIALGVLFRQMSTSEKFWLTFAGLNNTAMLRFEHGSAYLICALFAVYFMRLFPEESKALICRSLAVFSLLLLCMALFTPIQFFSSRVDLLHFNIIINAINGLFILGQALRKGRHQSFLMLLALCALIIPTTLDMLITGKIIEGRFFMPMGLIPFIMAQSYALATRYTRDTKEAEKLRVTTERLTQLDEIKTNFLANVSHELRTPISLIKAPVEAIMAGDYGESIPRDHHVFTLIQGNANRLLRLIENLLNLTRLESAQNYTLKPVDLCELLPAYRDEFLALAEKASLSLDLHIDRGEAAHIVSPIDFKALESIVFNLLSNAIKFTPPGGKVTLSLYREVRGKKEWAIIEVRDTGIGIEEEDQKNLFTRYRRIYDTSRHHYEGSGLGLSIAPGTARARGGDLGVHSEAGKGSSFFVSLPISSEEPIALRKKSSPPEESGEQVSPTDLVSAITSAKLDTSLVREAKRPRYRILIVEDHGDLRSFIASSLGTQYEVRQASDGMEALSILKKEAVPDLILSDIMMPRLDGIGLYEQVSKDPILTAVPFIFLTARDEPDERLKQLRQGAVHYILKPFSIEELKAVIGSTLRIHESARGGMLEKLKNALMGMGQTPYKERETVEENPYPEDITSREREILDLVVQGLSDKEIADRLGLSTRTASNHVASILRKTGLSSRQSLRQRFEKRPVAEWTGAT